MNIPREVVERALAHWDAGQFAAAEIVLRAALSAQQEPAAICSGFDSPVPVDTTYRTQPAAPGWQLVPVEPTQEMIAAMACAWVYAVKADDPNEGIAEYRAALLAAPQPQQTSREFETGDIVRVKKETYHGKPVGTLAKVLGVNEIGWLRIKYDKHNVETLSPDFLEQAAPQQVGE